MKNKYNVDRSNIKILFIMSAYSIFFFLLPFAAYYVGHLAGFVQSYKEWLEMGINRGPWHFELTAFSKG